MELRTTFKIEPSADRITYNDSVMFIGSCFATSVGKQFQAGRMPVLINPSGTVFNPVSVSNTIDTITRNEKYQSDHLYYHDGNWISFDHYTDFSSPDKEELLRRIDENSEEALKFISGARFLFVTFGTARVYRWNNTGKIVSNCHKIAASHFKHELLTVDYIISLWNEQLDKLKKLFPDLRVVFTISPVRHWKDGAHGNQVSKSVLFLAIEKLLEHHSRPSYFPAYELVMDDLRDYRFYGSDMLHVSDLAVNYIWDAFCSCYFDTPTLTLWHEVEKITRAVSHRIQTDSGEKIKKFVESMILKIEKLARENPMLDLSAENDYFRKLKEAI